MKLDRLTLFIIADIFDKQIQKKTTSSWEIAKKFNWDKKPLFMDRKETKRYHNTKADLVQKRMNLLVTEGYLQQIDKDDTKFWTITDKIKIARHKFANRYSDSIQFLDKNNLWIIHEF